MVFRTIMIDAPAFKIVIGLVLTYVGLKMFAGGTMGTAKPSG